MEIKNENEIQKHITHIYIYRLAPIQLLPLYITIYKKIKINGISYKVMLILFNLLISFKT